MVYHVRRVTPRGHMLDLTLCGEPMTEHDTAAVWVHEELRMVGRWTEPERGFEICRRCFKLAEREMQG